jgi:hypothetical protein
MNPPPPVTRADRVRKSPSVTSSARSSTAKTPKHSSLAREEDTAEAVGVVVALTAPLIGSPIHTSGMRVEIHPEGRCPRRWGHANVRFVSSDSFEQEHVELDAAGAQRLGGDGEIANHGCDRVLYAVHLTAPSRTPDTLTTP